MSLGRAFLDAAVLVYAAGGPHPYQRPCLALVEGLAHERFAAETSVLVVQEYLHQRTRRTGDRAGAARLAGEVGYFCVVHDLRAADLATALELFAGSSGLDAADALHAAVALNRGTAVIISPDQAFDDVRGLQRLDPVAAARQLTS